LASCSIQGFSVRWRCRRVRRARQEFPAGLGSWAESFIRPRACRIQQLPQAAPSCADTDRDERISQAQRALTVFVDPVSVVCAAGRTAGGLSRGFIGGRFGRGRKLVGVSPLLGPSAQRMAPPRAAARMATWTSPGACPAAFLFPVPRTVCATSGGGRRIQRCGGATAPLAAPGGSLARKGPGQWFLDGYGCPFGFW